MIEVMTSTSRYLVSRCPGRITTEEANVIKQTDHSHAGDARQIQVREANSFIRQKAAESHSPPRRIIREATARMSKEAAIRLAKYETLSRNVCRNRRKENKTPHEPKVLAELKICGEFSRTIKDELFVLYDNKDGENRIIMFCTRDNLNFMAMCDDLYMDGTFDAAPLLFKQLYTIHGKTKEL